jgi:lysozyme family protein/cell wall-associated NlpC family hydrolase
LPIQLTEALRNEYLHLFANMIKNQSRLDEVARIYRRIARAENLNRYKQVEQMLGVPWFVIAIIHNLESEGRFDTHLHNGDPLTGRTIREPKGHPALDPAAGAGGCYTWPESAVDALRYDKVDCWNKDDWTVPGIAFVLERYNGFGYRRRFPFVKSPYLWSFSNIYTKGKFRFDGEFSTDEVSQQCGGMVLLGYMMDNDENVKARVARQEPPPVDDEPDAKPTPHAAQDNSHRDFPTPAHAYPGRYLLRGSTGDAVKDLQQRLADLGAAPLLNGVFDQVTKFAVQLFQARSVDSSGEPLEVDGVVGPNTWAALFGPDSVCGPATLPSMPPLRALASGRPLLTDTVLDIADSQVGVMERPPGSNRGPEVESYLASVDLAPGNPWCMAFVYWTFREASGASGMPNRVPKTGRVLDAWMRSQHLPEIMTVTVEEVQKDPSLVRPGMVFFMSTGNGNGHCGIVVENINGMLVTIEGNTNRGGSREGIGVFRREQRRINGSAIVGFASYG